MEHNTVSGGGGAANAPQLLSRWRSSSGSAVQAAHYWVPNHRSRGELAQRFFFNGTVNKLHQNNV